MIKNDWRIAVLTHTYVQHTPIKQLPLLLILHVRAGVVFGSVPLGNLSKLSNIVDTALLVLLLVLVALLSLSLYSIIISAPSPFSLVLVSFSLVLDLLLLPLTIPVVPPSPDPPPLR
jgi:hypothetical protein